MEAIEDIKNNKTPKSSFDFLFIVEHPRLEKFYQNLRNAGNLIGVGDTTGIKLPEILFRLMPSQSEYLIMIYLGLYKSLNKGAFQI
jgi:hypothetical protein